MVSSLAATLPVRGVLSQKGTVAGSIAHVVAEMVLVPAMESCSVFVSVSSMASSVVALRLRVSLRSTELAVSPITVTPSP